MKNTVNAGTRPGNQEGESAKWSPVQAGAISARHAVNDQSARPDLDKVFQCDSTAACSVMAGLRRLSRADATLEGLGNTDTTSTRVDLRARPRCLRMSENKQIEDSRRLSPARFARKTVPHLGRIAPQMTSDQPDTVSTGSETKRAMNPADEIGLAGDSSGLEASLGAGKADARFSLAIRSSASKESPAQGEGPDGRRASPKTPPTRVCCSPKRPAIRVPPFAYSPKAIFSIRGPRWTIFNTLTESIRRACGFLG